MQELKSSEVVAQQLKDTLEQTPEPVIMFNINEDLQKIIPQLTDAKYSYYGNATFPVNSSEGFIYKLIIYYGAPTLPVCSACFMYHAVKQYYELNQAESRGSAVDRFHPNDLDSRTRSIIGI